MWNWLATAHELARAGRPFALVTVIQAKGSTPRDPGAKLLVEADGTFHGTVGGGRLEQLVLEDARRYLSEALSAPRKYPLCMRTNQCCGGSVDVFIETCGVGPLLYLFGAGHVGRALCQTLAGTPFQVHVIDERPEWVQSPELPGGVVRHQQGWQEFMGGALWDARRVYAAVMTHDHQLDLAIIQDLTARAAKFIGLIGSTTKWERFRQRLTASGVEAEMLARVHCPIGLGRCGKAPQEVAVSVAAQLLTLYHGEHFGEEARVDEARVDGPRMTGPQVDGAQAEPDARGG